MISDCFFWDTELSPIEDISDGGMCTVYPQISDDIIINPYRGYTFYGTSTQTGDSLIGSSEIKNLFSTIVCRPLWSDIEYEEGKYDWSKVDNALALAEEYGIQVGLGFQAAYNNKGSMNGQKAANVIKQASPLWLFDECGCSYTVTYYDGDNAAGRVTAKVPVWDDPVYIDKMGNFINAFLERYNGNPYIAYVDMRTYGNWGEWHVGALDGPEDGEDDDSKPIGLEAMKKHIDLWRNSKIPTVMLGGEEQAVQYARETLDCGVRLDGLLNPNDSNTHKRMIDYKDQALLVGEWIEPVYNTVNGAKKWEGITQYLPVLFERTMQETGISIMSMANHSNQVFYNEYSDLVEYWANKMGYRFRAVKIEYPTALTEGNFKLTLKNDGSTRMFNGSNIAGIKLALLDKNNNIIDTVELDNDDLTMIDAGEFFSIDENYLFNNTEGAAKLAVGFFSDNNYISPDIKLANSSSTAGNWYLVSEMPVIPPEDKMNMAILSANSEEVVAGYGYHHSDYAFDGDTGSYWSAKLDKLCALEANFSELQNLQKIVYTIPENINASYRLMAENQNGWCVLEQGDSLLAGVYTYEGTEPFEALSLKLEFDPVDNELLINADFENGLNNWMNYASSNIAAETYEVYSGTGAAKIYNRDSAYRGIAYDITDVLLENGNGKYNFKIMIKSVDDEKMYSLKIGYWDTDNNRHTFGHAEEMCYPDRWTELGISECDINLENVSKVWFYIESGDGNISDFYVDSASMEKTNVIISEGELLYNSAFEEDVYYSFGWNGYASSKILYETENVYDGNGAAMVFGRKTEETDENGYSKGYYKGIQQDIKSVLEENGAGKYTFKIMLKTDDIIDLNDPKDETSGYKSSVKYLLRISVKYSDGKDPIGKSGSALCGNDGWTLLEVSDMDISSTENILSAIVYVESGDKNVTDFYVDAASMVKTE